MDEGILRDCSGSKDETELCLTCADGFASVSSSDGCVECPTGSITSVVLFGVVLWSIFLILTLTFLSTDDSSSYSSLVKAQRNRLSLTAEDSNRKASARKISVGLIKVLLHHFQLLSLFLFVNGSFSGASETFMVISEALTMSGLNWASCVFKDFRLQVGTEALVSFPSQEQVQEEEGSILYSKAMFAAILPWILLAVTILMSSAIYLFELRRTFQERLTFADVRDRCFSILLVLCLVITPFSVRIGFSLIPCIQPGTGIDSAVLADGEYRCNGEVHQMWRNFIGITLLIGVYGVGVFFLLFFLLGSHRSMGFKKIISHFMGRKSSGTENEDKSKSLAVMGVLIRPYKDEFFFWELIEMLILLLCTASAVLLQLEPRRQLLQMSVLLLLNLCITVGYKPMKLKTLNVLKAMSSFVLLFSSFATAINLVSRETVLELRVDDVSADRIDAIMLLANVLFLFVGFMLFFSAFSGGVLSDLEDQMRKEDERVGLEPEVGGLKDGESIISAKMRFWRFFHRVSTVLSLNLYNLKDSKTDYSSNAANEKLLAADDAGSINVGEKWRVAELNVSHLTSLLNMETGKKNRRFSDQATSTANSDAISLAETNYDSDARSQGSASGRFDLAEMFSFREEVEIIGLRKNKEFNGQRAFFLNKLPEKKRIEVELKESSQTVLRLKRRNLRRLQLNLDCCSEASSRASSVGSYEADELYEGDNVRIINLKKQQQFEGLPAEFVRRVENRRVEVRLENGTVLRLKTKNIEKAERLDEDDGFTVYSDHSSKSTGSSVDKFLSRFERADKEWKLMVVNLKKAQLKAEFEGKVGNFMSLDIKSKRVAIKLDNGAILKLKSRNLEIVSKPNDRERDVISVAGTEFTSRTKREKKKKELEVGQMVVVGGLKKTPEFNDKLGKFVGFDEDSGKAEVELDDGRVLRLRSKNLTPCAGNDTLNEEDNAVLNGVTTRNSEAVSFSALLNSVSVKEEDLVRLKGLKKKAEMNGQIGKVRKILDQGKKAEIELNSGVVMLVRVKNLEVVVADVASEIKSHKHTSEIENEELRKKLATLQKENLMLKRELDYLDASNQQRLFST